MTENTPKGIYFDVKKKPYDIEIDNNKKEPKLSKNVKYTDKQNYRRYKTLTEPKLLGRIMVDANDSQTLDIQEQIQRLLGLKPPQKKDERLPEGADVFTAPSAYVAPPNPKAVNIEPDARERLMEEPIPLSRNLGPDDDFSGIQAGLFDFKDGINAINDVTIKDSQELLGQIIDNAVEESIASQELKETQKRVQELAQRVFKSPNINLDTDKEIQALLRTIENEDSKLEALDSAKKSFGLAKELFGNERPEAQKTLSRAWKANKARKEMKSKMMENALQQKSQVGDELGSIGSSVLSGASTIPAKPGRRGRPIGSVKGSTTRSKSQGRTLDLREPSIIE